MKTSEIRELSKDQITDELVKFKKEQLNLRFQKNQWSIGQYGKS